MTFKTSHLCNWAYYWIGLSFLFLNKIRHSIRGYARPRPFPITDFKRAIEYDFNVFNHWIRVLEEYVGNKVPLKGKTMLELGPGADLGIGIICLMEGAKKYHAIDISNLALQAPQQFYHELFSYIESNIKEKELDLDYLSSQLMATQLGKNDKVNYICISDFDLSVFKDQKIDLVFSQAAFEHFDNVDRTVSQLSEIVETGTILIAEVDLRTHTRWIRDVDPLNIYRYSDTIYSLFRFRGSPNRIRPFEYKDYFEKQGWTKVNIIPLTRLEREYVAQINDRLSKKFRDPANQMEYLSIMICATKK